MPVRPAMMALALGGFGIGTTEFVAMGLLPQIADGMGVSEPAAGHVISAYALGVVVGAPTISALTARLDRRRLLVALMAAFTLGNAVTVLAPSMNVLIGSRFVAGLPHGAYFGVASLVAARLAGAGRRAKAVATVMLGLSVANVVGVPLASAMGQQLGWRSAFGLVAVIGLATMAALLRWVPSMESGPSAGPRAELGALRRPQVWLTLAVGMVGFGGMFAVYTYIATTLTDVAGLPSALVPLALALYGVGMVAGNLVGGRLADRALMPSMFTMLVLIAAVMGLFVAAAHNPVTALAAVFMVGASGAAMVPALQTRLMDVAADAQNLAAALNHSALNVANAGGAWLGGVVIAAGFGYTAPAAVGAGLALAGLVVLAVSAALQKRSDARDGRTAADREGEPVAVH